ncbi:rhodanese-like domain-containing protein [Aequorivita echinoideorum]|uniref:Rhodanese-like domain-containing protein n=2 Tax=Aequorivita echinoideorum TaxID=1549647 RepID=A0ABS5S4T3_9FLAO|nr:rhodanese-like domain-containing protein [Aequorivita echinoideorum]MBT0607409.1 rhodanese-like domain-containing protein [Aequorivita echinoideorum]
MEDLSQKEWREKLAEDANAMIIDVRSDEELEEGFIPGAKQMDIRNPNEFMETAHQLDTSKNYYVYCRSGARSSQACAIFNSLGIKNTYNLEGGFMEWDGEKTK